MIAFSLMSSCSNDDENEQVATVNGVWNLKNISGGIAGVNIDYKEGDVIWDFNVDADLLTVENNIMTTGPEDIYAGLESGTYAIDIVQNGETMTLFIDEIKRGILILSENNLIIDDDIAADGFITEFER